MLEYLLRFIAAGGAVSAFATFGDMLRPKSLVPQTLGAGSLKPEQTAVLGRITVVVSRKRRRGSRWLRAASPDYSVAHVEQGYSRSFENLLAQSLIAFIATFGPFHPMISSFLFSSSSVATKNFSSSC